MKLQWRNVAHGGALIATKAVFVPGSSEPHRIEVRRMKDQQHIKVTQFRQGAGPRKASWSIFVRKMSSANDFRSSAMEFPDASPTAAGAKAIAQQLVDSGQLLFERPPPIEAWTF